MRRVAFVVGPALGHVGRMIRIACALEARTACRVVFVTPEQGRFACTLVELRFKVIRLPVAGEATCLPMTDFSVRLEPVLDAGGFDLVAYDLDPMRWISCLRPPEAPSVHVTNAVLTRPAGRRTIQCSRFERHGAAINAVRAERGLAPLGSAYDLYEGTRVLLADPAAVCARCFAPLPPSYLACGACVWAMQGALPAELETAEDILLVSTGSTGRGPRGMRLIAALAEAAGCRQVVAVGARVDGDGAPGLPVRWFASLPLAEILPRTRMVLCHGGSGSVYQALAHGVPVAVLPGHSNHRILADLLEEMGVAVTVGEDAERLGLDAPRLAGMSQRARALGAAMRAEDGPERAADSMAELMA